MFLPPLLEANPDDLAGEGLPRLRFVACSVERAAAATTRVTVAVDGPSRDQRIESRAEGSTCVGGDLRLPAQAMLDVVVQATQGAVRFELIGVKLLRAFDTNVIVAAINAYGDGVSRRLIGTAIADDDPIAGAALATLHATNRFVAPLLTVDAAPSRA